MVVGWSSWGNSRIPFRSYRYARGQAVSSDRTVKRGVALQLPSCCVDPFVRLQVQAYILYHVVVVKRTVVAFRVMQNPHITAGLRCPLSRIMCRK